MAPKKPAELLPTKVTNDGDAELYYPTLGVTLQPGESFTPPVDDSAPKDKE